MESSQTASVTSAPIRCDEQLSRFENTDARLLAWARELNATEAQFPSLINRPVLTRAGYPDAFPHLLLSACACINPALPLTDLLAAENLTPSDWLLSPAVCYHAYGHWQGETISTGRALTARGRCFRREDEFIPGRRQLEFEMREIILCGSPAWLETILAAAPERVATIAESAGISEGDWATASDPFFLPTASGKALIQRLHETKKEFVVSQNGYAAPLAIASINRHGAFFGERFNLRLPDGSPAHTACIAFGLDRWAAVSTAVAN